MNFYQFYQKQWEIENKGIGENFDILKKKLTFPYITWFTISAKCAIEENNSKHPDYPGLNTWRYEVEAMLAAYMRTGYITADDYCDILTQFKHLMRVSYRLHEYWHRRK